MNFNKTNINELLVFMGMVAGYINELTNAENSKSEHRERFVVSYVLGG